MYCKILLYFIADVDEKVSEKLFLERPPDALICAICLDIINTPVQATCCGKLFCKVCQENSIKQDTKCPHCRNTMKVFEDKRCQQEINALKIVCPYYVRDCAWSGCVSDLKQHIDNCQYKFVKCPNHCKYNTYSDAYLLRKHLENHLANTCADRLVTCEHCKNKTKSKDLNDHHNNCKRYPIPCPNKACKEKIPREEKNQHVDKCAYTTVPCQYKEFGCGTKMMRKDVDNHLTDVKMMSYHISLLATELKKEKEARIALEKKLNK